MNIGIGEKVKKLRQDLGLSLNQVSQLFHRESPELRCSADSQIRTSGRSER